MSVAAGVGFYMAARRSRRPEVISAGHSLRLLRLVILNRGMPFADALLPTWVSIDRLTLYTF